MHQNQGYFENQPCGGLMMNIIPSGNTSNTIVGNARKIAENESVGMQNAHRKESAMLNALFSDPKQPNQKNPKENTRTSRYSRQNLFMENRIISMTNDDLQNVASSVVLMPHIGIQNENNTTHKGVMNALFSDPKQPNQRKHKENACTSRASRHSLFMENRITSMSTESQVPNNGAQKPVGCIESMEQMQHQDTMSQAKLNMSQAIHFMVTARNLNPNQQQQIQKVLKLNTQQYSYNQDLYKKAR